MCEASRTGLFHKPQVHCHWTVSTTRHAEHAENADFGDVDVKTPPMLRCFMRFAWSKQPVDQFQTLPKLLDSPTWGCVPTVIIDMSARASVLDQ